LAGAQAKVIGNTVFFVEPQIDPGLIYINKISKFVENSSTPETEDITYGLDELKALLQEAESALNTDAKLAESFKNADNVILAMPFIVGEPRGNPDRPLPEYVV